MTDIYENIYENISRISFQGTFQIDEHFNSGNIIDSDKRRDVLNKCANKFLDLIRSEPLPSKKRVALIIESFYSFSKGIVKKSNSDILFEMVLKLIEEVERESDCDISVEEIKSFFPEWFDSQPVLK